MKQLTPKQRDKVLDVLFGVGYRHVIHILYDEAKEYLNEITAHTEPEGECHCGMIDMIEPNVIVCLDCGKSIKWSEFDTEPEDECEHTTWYGRGSISVCADCHKTYEEANTAEEDK